VVVVVIMVVTPLLTLVVVLDEVVTVLVVGDGFVVVVVVVGVDDGVGFELELVDDEDDELEEEDEEEEEEEAKGWTNVVVRFPKAVDNNLPFTLPSPVQQSNPVPAEYEFSPSFGKESLFPTVMSLNTMDRWFVSDQTRYRAE
jgi:hypothetical protein